jgi:hypothetical protein
MRTFLQESIADRHITLIDTNPKVGDHFRQLLRGFEVDDENWVGPNAISRFAKQALSILPL